MKKKKIKLGKNRFSFSFSLLCFFLIIFLTSSHLYSANEVREERLNFLLITIDTLRADRLSCYSRKHLKTPNIDSLAEKGILFSRAFSNTSTTLPSHTNILLGTTPLYHGVHENLNFIVREELFTLAEYLKNYGYSTGAFVGAYPLDSRFGLAQGFDIYDDEYVRPHFQKFTSPQRKAEAVVDSALDWLRDKESPWFLWIHCFDPHIPYEPPEPFKTQYKNHLYNGEVAYVDSVMANLLSFMKENNLFDKTLIVFTGDHGESLGQHGEETHGHFAYNATIWIPLIFAFPGVTQGQVDQYVSHLDIFPTVCEVLHIKKPSFLQGISLLPVIKGKKLSKRPIYFESMYPYYSRGMAPLRGFIYNKEKFIESPIPELYDLGQDFDELMNLAEGKRLDRYRKQLVRIINDQSSPENIKAKKKFDRESLEKLRSLGYVSSIQVPKKESFGPEDDVKVLLPYHNKASKARDLYQMGKVKEGFKLLKEIITERKDIDSAYFHLAAMYKETGRTKDAIEVFNMALENIPSSYSIFSNYIKCLIDAGQYDEVIKVFGEKSYRQMELDPEILNNLGYAYARKEDLEKAIEAYEKALSLDDKYAELFFNLGDAYYSLGIKTKDPRILRKSFGFLKKAIEIDPDYPAPYHCLGMAYKQAGNLDGAIYCWEKALEIEPNFGQALINLSRAYLEKGDKSKALGSFKEYKKQYYHLLSVAEKKKLDAWIQKCKKEP